MKTSFAAVLSLALAGGCVVDNGDEARNAIPSADSMQIKLPAAMKAKPDGIGQLAEFYILTRQISDTLNGGAAVTLTLVKAITLYPVTSISNGTYTWGPWSDSLKPAEYELTVTAQGSGQWAWALQGRAKNTQDAFVAVISGVATPGRPGRGSGTFSIDFDAGKALDPAGSTADGQIAVTYDLESEPAHVTMDYQHLAPMPDGSQAEATFHYYYSEASDGTGDFQWQSYADTDDPGPAWETSNIRSRWEPTGAGRSDVMINGGDLGTVSVTASECWDTSFDEVFYVDSANWKPTAGDVSACAYADALYTDQQL